MLLNYYSILGAINCANSFILVKVAAKYVKVLLRKLLSTLISKGIINI